MQDLFPEGIGGTPVDCTGYYEDGPGPADQSAKDARLRSLLEKADPTCAFDDAELGDLGRRIRASRAFTFMFWMKSNDPGARFLALSELMPLSSVFAIKDFVYGVPDASSNNKFRAEIGRKWGTEDIEIFQKPKAGSWSMRTIIVEGNQDGQGAKLTYILNSTHFETDSVDTAVFTDVPIEAFYFPTGGYVTPIHIYDAALEPSQVQQLYYDNQYRFENLDGPRELDRTRSEKASMSVTRFPYRIVLLAPPVVFQTRRKPEVCEGEGNRIVMQGQASAARAKCGSEDSPSRYECSGVDWSDLFQCMSVERVGEGEYFMDQPALPFNRTAGERVWGFAEFLYVLANPIVVRNQAEVSNRFLDHLTKEVQIIFVFYTPSKKVTTLVQWILTMHDDQVGFESTVNFSHLVPLSKADVRLWFQLAGAIFAVSACLLIFALTRLRQALASPDNYQAEVRRVMQAFKVQDRETVGKFSLFITLLDIVCAVVIPVYVAIKMQSAVGSEKLSNDTITDMVKIDWSSPTLSMVEKTSTFFMNVNRFMTTAEEAATLKTMALAIMLWLVARIVYSLGAHPRISLVTSTLGKAADDIFHFAGIFFMLYVMLALIAQFQFGSGRYGETYGAIFSAMAAQFHYMIGELNDEWKDENAFAVYFIFFMVVVFFLMLNFLMSIIIDAYTGVKKDLEQQLTEQNFFLDVLATVRCLCMSLWHRWPAGVPLARQLHLLQGTRKIGFQELYRTGLFPSSRSCVAFIEFYWDQYSFLRLRGRRRKLGGRHKRRHMSMARGMSTTTPGLTPGMPTPGYDDYDAAPGVPPCDLPPDDQLTRLEQLVTRRFAQLEQLIEAQSGEKHARPSRTQDQGVAPSEARVRIQSKHASDPARASVGMGRPAAAPPGTCDNFDSDDSDEA